MGRRAQGCPERTVLPPDDPLLPGVPRAKEPGPVYRDAGRIRARPPEQADARHAALRPDPAGLLAAGKDRPIATGRAAPRGVRDGPPGKATACRDGCRRVRGHPACAVVQGKDDRSPGALPARRPDFERLRFLPALPRENRLAILPVHLLSRRLDLLRRRRVRAPRLGGPRVRGDDRAGALAPPEAPLAACRLVLVRGHAGAGDRARSGRGAVDGRPVTGEATRCCSATGWP